MRTLTGQEMLRIWEVGSAQTPVERSLTILAAALPDATVDELLALSVGQRDAYLLRAREMLFGSALAGYSECPSCRERLEFALDLASLPAAPSFDASGQTLELAMAGYTLRFRVPGNQDLVAIGHHPDPATAPLVLARRCVLDAQYRGRRIEFGELPAPVIDALAQRMAESDPLAEVMLDLQCPACGHAWQTLFDILAFLWTELAAQARRVLREVVTLASAFGWREADILAMSARRRQSYLELIGA